MNMACEMINFVSWSQLSIGQLQFSEITFNAVMHCNKGAGGSTKTALHMKHW